MDMRKFCNSLGAQQKEEKVGRVRKATKASKKLDSATQSGLQSVIEKVCLRDEIFESANAAEAQQTLTVDSAAVQAPHGMHLQHRSPHIVHNNSYFISGSQHTQQLATLAHCIFTRVASLRSI